MVGSLQQIAGEHRVLVWTHALSYTGSRVGILDDFQLVLLIFVEEGIKGIGGQVNALCNQTGEEHADFAHAFHIVFEYGAEEREELLVGPLIGCK